MKVNKTNNDLISRLEDWKFEQATNYLKGENQTVVTLVHSLSTTFGNCGWFYGNLANIVYECLNSILPQRVERIGE